MYINNFKKNHVIEVILFFYIFSKTFICIIILLYVLSYKFPYNLRVIDFTTLFASLRCIYYKQLYNFLSKHAI